ncbi:MAG: CIA30 family protein [Planctomycetota bacterium]|nr:CIA30 family protein [Planctomycetota bacterium]
MPHILRGALVTLAALTFGGGASADPSDLLLTDFSAEASVRWVTVNDGVMGGRSRGGFQVADGVLRFRGSTNTKGGGFSSIRSRPVDLDLSSYEGIRLRVRADGRRYTFRLTTSSSRRGRYQPSYWADFETRKGTEWQVVDVPFERFRPRWRGRMLSGPKLDLARIDGLGLMIYDKRDGPFRFDADWIRAYRSRPTFSMKRYQWKQRPLVVFAPEEADKRLIRQLVSIQGAKDGFRERDMALIVVVDTGVSTADGSPLTLAEAAALRRAYRIPAGSFAVRLVGKDGGVKRESAEVVEPTALFRQIDAMPMRQREMRKHDGGS